MDMHSFIDRHKVGIAATLIFHIGVVVAMNVFYFQGGPGLQGDELMDIVLEAEELERLLQETEAFEKIQAEEVTTGIKNLSVKERLERGKEVRLNAAAEKWTDEQIRKELEALESSEFDRLAEEHGPVEKYKPKERKEIDAPEESKQDAATIAGPATVTCDLPGRSEVGQVYIPAYLCKGQGKVVVDITVDRSGAVEQAKVNEKVSTSSLPCHLSFAQDAAASTHFSKSARAEPHQKGTITYLFLAQ